MPRSAPQTLESVSHLSLTIPINHKGMFGGLWGNRGAGREAAQLAEDGDGNTRLPSFAAAGATDTPQPSDWVEGLGDRREGFGENAACGKAESWQSERAHALQNVILALLPPSLLLHTIFPADFTRGWDQAKGDNSKRKQGIQHPLPLLSMPSSFISEEEPSHLQEPRHWIAFKSLTYLI